MANCRNIPLGRPFGARTPVERGRRRAALALLVAGGALLGLGLALVLDRASLRDWALRLPGTTLARAAYALHAALDHTGAQAYEALLAALGVGLLTLAPLLLSRHRLALWIGAGLTLLIALGGGVGLLASAQRERDAGVVTYQRLSRRHQAEPVVSPKLPPAGGPHARQWQNCGVYDRAIPNEYAVHSLEHGAVWIAYRPDLAPAEIAALRALARQGDYRLLSPDPGLLSPIVVTAWGRQLLLDRADDPRLAAFLRRNAQDSRAPEPGGACAHGHGEPSR